MMTTRMAVDAGADGDGDGDGDENGDDDGVEIGDDDFSFSSFPSLSEHKRN